MRGIFGKRSSLRQCLHLPTYKRNYEATIQQLAAGLLLSLLRSPSPSISLPVYSSMASHSCVAGRTRPVLCSYSYVSKTRLLHDTLLAGNHNCSTLAGSSSGAPRSIIHAPVELSKRRVGLAAPYLALNSFKAAAPRIVSLCPEDLVLCQSLVHAAQALSVLTQDDHGRVKWSSWSV